MTARLADPIVFGPSYIPLAPYEPYVRFGDGQAVGGFWWRDVLRCTRCNRRIRTGELIGVPLMDHCADCCAALETRIENQ